MDFKLFLEADQHEEDIRKTLRKLPAEHQKLIKGYKFKFIADGTLKNDDSHVGIIDEEKKVITIAAPWNFGKEIVMLHEIAHLIWKYSVEKDKKESWKKIIDSFEHKQGTEEMFCMYYAAHYANHSPTTYDNKKALKFIKGLK